uniref:Extended synaptotagmin 1 n=1 Tax=Cairina moschata TaxID=8855 RepID=A0A8C3BWL9_CAIMO
MGKRGPPAGTARSRCLQREGGGCGPGRGARSRYGPVTVPFPLPLRFRSRSHPGPVPIPFPVPSRSLSPFLIPVPVPILIPIPFPFPFPSPFLFPSPSPSWSLSPFPIPFPVPFPRPAAAALPPPSRSPPVALHHPRSGPEVPPRFCSPQDPAASPRPAPPCAPPGVPVPAIRYLPRLPPCRDSRGSGGGRFLPACSLGRPQRPHPPPGGLGGAETPPMAPNAVPPTPRPPEGAGLRPGVGHSPGGGETEARGWRLPTPPRHQGLPNEPPPRPPRPQVSFPDVERAEWLNKVLAQAWPFFGQYMEKLLTESIAPAIRASNSHLQTFTFTKVDMGEKPLRVLGVRAHPGTHKRQILLDLNISYVGDVQIDVEVKKFFCKAGVKGMQLHGTLRIILEPLLGDVPIVGALTMFFIRRPTLDINWTGMTNLLDIPGLSSVSDTMIMDTIASYLVLPNRLLVPLVPDLHEAAQLRCPLPRGVVRVHLLGARELRSKDRFMGGLVEGKSDPYAVLRVGTQLVTSRVVPNELNPTWDEVYEFIVHEVPGQEMEVELFDKDPDQDDLLGRMKLDFGEVLKARVLDEVRRLWVGFGEGGGTGGAVKDDPRQGSLGSLSLPLSRLLQAPELTLAQPFPLQHSGPCSRLYMKLVLRVLYLDAPEGSAPPLELPVGADAGTGGTRRPSKASPAPQFGTEAVLRIHLLEAEDLVAKDNFLGGMVRGRSDPYAKVRVAGRAFRSRVVKEELNPRWNEIYEAVVDNVPGQDVEFDLFDKDIDKDDFLGRWVLGGGDR